MKTKLLLTSSTIFNVILGFITSFLPQEMLAYVGIIGSDIAVLFVQVMGALYFGLAIMNWMSRDAIMGGIYNRPLAIGNFMHYAMVSTALLKANELISIPSLLIIAIIYVLFAIWFGLVLFRKPKIN